MFPARAFASRAAVVAGLLIGFGIITESLLAIRQEAREPELPIAAQIDTLEQGTFGFTHTFTVHGKPESVYDALTGDITPWWDHSVSGRRKRMFIEARPGGGFYELIGNNGDGIRHAVVTYAIRGERLTMQGPLPFSGHPIDMLTTYALAPVGDSTRIVLTVRAAGEIQSQWPTRIEKTWRHFIYERFIPYWTAKEKDTARSVASNHAR